jgi:uncharacterized Zn finger protein (UPF0148 family)
VGAIKEKVAYLRGLAEGFSVGDSTKEGRLLKEIISLLSEVAGELDMIHAKQAEMEDHIEGLDEDVADLEQLVYDDDDDLLELTCPHCHEEFFDPKLLDDDVDEITCPVCGEVMLEDEDDDEDDDDEDLTDFDEDDDDDEDDEKVKGRH